MLQNLQRQLLANGRAVWQRVQPFKWRLGYFLVFIFFIWYKDFQIQLELNSGKFRQNQIFSEKTKIDNPAAEKVYSKNKFDKTKPSKPEIAKTVAQPIVPNVSPKITNSQRSYVRRFAHVARAEMKKYGIPASITLAQGLLESNSGKSPLASEANNHFGIKCFSKKCGKGHCKNFSDDSHKDFFRVYPSAWESYRAHSLFLQRNRYKHLKKLGNEDYRSWAVGLKKAGYATDPKYAEKLIGLIEGLDLGRFDS